MPTVAPMRGASERPLFTVAIPTFNRAEWLERCVASALSQTYGSFEVLVSDNASDDATGEVLGRCSDERLTVIRQPRNIGAIANWNACVAAARGAYIVMLSDDDTVAPHLLERCARFVSGDSEIPAVVALGDVLHVEAEFLRPAVASRTLESGVYKGTEILAEFLRGNISPQMCTIAMRTETLRSRGGFPAGWPHAGDLASWVPLLLEGSAGFINTSCGTHSTHQDTQTARFAADARLGDIDRLGRVIIEGAERKVRDRATLLQITKLTRKYVARNLIGHLASERREGATRSAVAHMAWEWRREVASVGFEGLPTVANFVCMALLPLSMIALASRARRTLRRITGGSPA